MFDLLARLAGRHRIQRVSPTEKRGRRHSSEVSVSVCGVDGSPQVQLELRDVQIRVARGSGPGGQHRNKTESAVTATHLPTGITARVDGRSQHQNRQLALRVLSARLDAQDASERLRKRSEERNHKPALSRSFTWTTWRDEVVGPGDKRTSMKQALRGKLDPLLE